MKSKYYILFFIFIVGAAQAQNATWSFDAFGGLPYNFPTPLTIKQQNEPTIKLFARYYTEPMTLPVYWVWRVSRVADKKGWEFEVMHHKLYLKNRPPEVQQFSISHGHNIMTINRIHKRLFLNRVTYCTHLGAGLVLAHPENIVRYKGLNPDAGLLGLGYYFTGPVLNIAISKRFYLIDRFYINTEIKLNPSINWVPVGDGHAVVWNLPAAFIFGIGFDFIGVSDN